MDIFEDNSPTDFSYINIQGSKCPSLPGLTHWVNPGLPRFGFKPYFGKVGNTGESNILNVQNCANL